MFRKVSISEPIPFQTKLYSLTSSSIQERIIKRNFKSVQAVYSVKPGKVIIDIPLTHSEIETMFIFSFTIKYLNYQPTQLMEITKKVLD